MTPRSKRPQPSQAATTTDPDTGLPGVDQFNRNTFLRVVHTADIHLRMSQDSSTVRGQDFFKAALSVVDIARDYNADMILNAGDFLNVPECQSLVLHQMLEIDARLTAISKPMYVVQGNHDLSTPSWTSVINGETGSAAAIVGNPNKVGLRNGDGLIPGTGILCLPFLTPSDLRKRLADMTPQEKREAKVLVWHGPVLEFSKFPSEGVLTIADFMVHPWEAVLLGDIHIRKYVNYTRPDGGTAIVGYPGATELCNIAEPLEHSCTVIDFDASMKVVAMTHVPVNHRKVLPLRINSAEELGVAASQIEEKVKTTDRLMVLVKYSDAITGVRHRLQLAAGSTDTIIRAESYVTFKDAPTDLTALTMAELPKPMEYLERVAPGISTPLRTLCLQLDNTESAVSPAEQLNVYCQSRLPV